MQHKWHHTSQKRRTYIFLLFTTNQRIHDAHARTQASNAAHIQEAEARVPRESPHLDVLPFLFEAASCWRCMYVSVMIVWCMRRYHVCVVCTYVSCLCCMHVCIMLVFYACISCMYHACVLCTQLPCFMLYIRKLVFPGTRSNTNIYTCVGMCRYACACAHVYTCMIRFAQPMPNRYISHMIILAISTALSLK